MTFPPEIVILSKLSGEDGGTEEPEAIIAGKLARGKDEKILKKDEKKFLTKAMKCGILNKLR